MIPSWKTYSLRVMEDNLTSLFSLIVRHRGSIQRTMNYGSHSFFVEFKVPFEEEYEQILEEINLATITGARIPANKYGQFVKLLSSHGGFLVTATECSGNYYMVSYTVDNYVAFSSDWKRVTTPIVEVYKNTWYNYWWNRATAFFGFKKFKKRVEEGLHGIRKIY